MIYGIFSGEYSDWDVEGYFVTMEEAEKFCALHPQCYIIEIENLSEKMNLSTVKVGYMHKLAFYLYEGKNDWRKCYQHFVSAYNANSKKKAHKMEYLPYDGCGYKIAFTLYLSTKNMDQATKVARDYLAKAQEYSNNIIPSLQAIDMMNEQFKEGIE